MFCRIRIEKKKKNGAQQNFESAECLLPGRIGFELFISLGDLHGKS
jgi:hypothetical protein